MTEEQTTGKRNKIPVVAAGIFLALCTAATIAVRFQTYDPAASAGDESFLDYCIIAGTVFAPVALVCFVRRLFEGRRFRLAISWLVGFLIPWSVLVYDIYFPHTPPEGYYCTKAEDCFSMAVAMAIVSGVINVFDIIVERLLRKLCNRWIRLAAWLQLMVFGVVLTLCVLSMIVLML